MPDAIPSPPPIPISAQVPASARTPVPTATGSPGPTPIQGPGPGPTLLRVVRAEVTKLLSLPLALCTAISTMLGCIGASWVLTALIDAAFRAGRPEETAGLETGSAFLVILHYGQIGVVLLAAWVVHQEADAGSLRTTLLCSPRRGTVVLAKALVVAVAAGIIGIVSALGSAGIRCTVIDCSSTSTSTSTLTSTLTSTSGTFAPTGAGEVRVLIGVVLYWVLIALFTSALAMLLRSGLAALGIVLALVLAVSTQILTLSPLARLLPDQAGAQLYQQSPVLSGDLGPLRGGAVLLAWTVAALLLAALAVRRRPVRD